MERIKDFLSNIFSSRLRVVAVVMAIFSVILICRLFYLQIINGSTYQDNYNLKLEKTTTIDATRGNIYDRNGNILAYNELTYAVTIEDTGTYSNNKVRSQSLNSEIAQIITNLEKNGDSIDNNFSIYIDSAGQFQFSVSGSALQRFRADIFGYTSVDELSYNEKLGFDEAAATADQIIDYLQGSNVYNISTEYDSKLRYEIMIVRYNMGQNSYQKYISTVIASDVSDESVAYIQENINNLTGVAVEEKSLRRYVDSEYYAHIIGYTGQISTSEYQELSATDDTVESTDIVGKSGIEKYMNDYLAGTKGYETLYVDSVGNTIAQGEKVNSVSGNDVYLSIDKDLQKAAYILLEKEIAGILYSKLANIKTVGNTSSSDVAVPIYDVYNSLIENGIIDTRAFEDSEASSTEKAVLSAYESKKQAVMATLKSQLSESNTTVYSELSDEYQAYSTYIVTSLKSRGIFNSDAIDTNSDVQTAWTSEEMAVNQYLIYAIEQNWIDITTYETESKYADTSELYSDLIDYVLNYLDTDSSFQKLIYKYMILNDEITGSQLCMILFDQGVLDMDESAYASLASGSLSAYEFMSEKIKNLEITPGQLALDPCSGSTVVIDTKTGEVLACVTYPGYDNNKLANSVDSEYYSYLINSQANPLYNYATQQRTAPGSTFKIVSSTAGMAEGVITPTSTITDMGIFEKVSNKPRCWIYTSTHGTHGSINVSEAIRDSCNYFFYEVGWRLSGGDNNYNDVTGIEKINEYASLYGLGDLTGVEIEENTPHIATEYPVMAAIGQSDNNFTTIGLARYAAAIANSGTVYNLTLLDSVRDSDGNVLEDYSPSVKNTIDVLDTAQWDAIHTGMRMVVESLSSFDGFSVEVAGKTGTAQQVSNRPNHALFIGYAPYDDPEIAIATRIAYGYTSHNAADVSKDILAYYFGVSSTEELLNGQASSVGNTGNTFTD